jgi:hypothetical protein
MRHKMVWCETFLRIRHHYGFCPSEKAWNALAKSSRRELGSYPANRTAAMTTLFQDTKNKTRTCIVTVAVQPPFQIVGLLSHEAMHVWRDIREGIGEESPSSEFEAYAMQNIFEELLTAYEKTRGRLFNRR